VRAADVLPEYEHPLYQDFRKDAPRWGPRSTAPPGPHGVGHNDPSDTVVVELAAERAGARVPKASVCGVAAAYESMHGSAEDGAEDG